MKRSLAFLFAILLLTPLTASAEPALPEIDIPFQKFVLDNGLTLIVHEDHKAPIVAVNVWYHVGSKNEVPGKTGFAHLFEHLMFNGSEHYNDEFFRPLEQVGATDMNGTTNNDRTNYFANVPTPSLDLLLWLESDRMGHLLGAIDQARLDEQRGVVQNEKRQRENAPYGRVWEILPANTYPQGHPYSWSVIGSMEDLNAASLEDVQTWFKQYYGAANAVLVVSGDVDADVVKSRVEHYFGAIPAGPPLEKQDQWVARMQGEHRMHMTDRVPQARIYKIWNVPGIADPLTPQMDLIADLLGGGKTSRLYQRLVYEDQLATGVDVGTWGKELGSQFLIIATAKPGIPVATLEKALNEELQRFLDDGPEGDELERTRTAMFANFVRGLERIGGFGGKADILASSEVYAGSPDAYKHYLQGLREADGEALQTAAKAWLDDGVFTLVVEPYEAGKTREDHVDRSKLPDSGTPPDLRLPVVEQYKLSNGIPVLIAERHETPVVQFQWVFDAGYASDLSNRPGTASLALSMLDEGTVQYDALELSAELERLGANISAGSSLDASTVSLSALSTLLDPSLALYAEVLRHPTFPDNELERLRQQRLAGIQQEKAEPMSMALRVLPPLLYGKEHPYGLPLTGSGDTESVKAITRADLQRFHHLWLRPDKATLIVVGDTTAEQVLPLLEEHFGDWRPDGPPISNKHFTTVERPGHSKVYLINRPDAEQSVILAGQVSAPYRTTGNTALETVNRILGGMFTSRLNMNLREDKHWSYGARTLLMDAREQRPFIAYAPVQADKTAESMREILSELRAIQGKKPADGNELEAAQNNLTLTLPGKHETSGQVLGSIAETVIYDLPENYFEQYVSEIRSLTTADLGKAVKRMYDPERLIWVIVGDLDKIEQPVRALKLGPVEILDMNSQ